MRRRLWTINLVFFSFWLSHVPPARFEEFWALVRTALKPSGQAFFIDSLPEPTSTAKDHGPLDESGVSRRKLNDGREFDIVKVWDIFGEDRLLYGSDWPNSAGNWVPYATELALVREYFTAKGRPAAEKYFWKNSIAAYKWVKRDPKQPQLSA